MAKSPVSEAPAKSDSAPTETTEKGSVSKATPEPTPAPDSFWTGTSLPRRPLDIPDPDLFADTEKTVPRDEKTAESSPPVADESPPDKPSESESVPIASTEESTEKPVAEDKKPPSYGRRGRR